MSDFIDGMINLRHRKYVKDRCIDCQLYHALTENKMSCIEKMRIIRLKFNLLCIHKFVYMLNDIRLVLCYENIRGGRDE